MRTAKRYKPHARYSRPSGRPDTGRRLIFAAAIVWLASSSPAPGQRAAPDNAKAEPPPAFLFDVALPITDAVEKSVARRVDRAIRQLSAGPSAAAGRRPIAIFEFRPGEGTASENSSFGDAVDLARFISGDRLRGVETVAWLPRTVKGHAVLPVLACERIVMAKDAELGAAGIQEKPPIEEAIRSAYVEYSARHRTVPPAIASAFVDSELAVFKVTTVQNTGVRYETAAELKRLREEGASFVTLTKHGELRGCIGALEAYQPLAQDVREHAVAAALEDPRFPPVQERELGAIQLEVSRLTRPRPLEYKNADDLLSKLRPHVDGVILREAFGRRATFLPLNRIKPTLFKDNDLLKKKLQG